VRWEAQLIGREEDSNSPLPGLSRIAGLLRSVRTPEFEGITFHEVLARSALNQVPPASRVPFRWTINQYRGCSHACVYCFARQTHTYLDLDAGADFNREIVVKVNVVEVLRRELARPSWRSEPVALGTNTDPYQRAEGRYRLMPGIITALADSGTSFSILTKGTTARRDLPLLTAVAQQVQVGMGVSIALVDERLQGGLEPGTPTPRARLALVRAITDAGLPCQVLVAPVLPLLTDSDEDLDRILGEVASANATSATVFPLHLRPGAREWFLRYVQERHPHLVEPYGRLYPRGPYVLPSYAADLARRVQPLLRRHGLASGAAFRPSTPPSTVAAAAQQGTLFS
jgi:DNA repair photolyase